jgi:hypothetical protein
MTQANLLQFFDAAPATRVRGTMSNSELYSIAERGGIGLCAIRLCRISRRLSEAARYGARFYRNQSPKAKLALRGRVAESLHAHLVKGAVLNFLGVEILLGTFVKSLYL